MKEGKGAPHFGVCDLKGYLDKSNSEADGSEENNVTSCNI